MDTTRKAKGRGARSIAEARKGEGMPRREALKSLVAGFAAVPLGAEGFAGGEQPLAAGKEKPRAGNARDELFDRGWRFHRGDAPGAERPDFDDSSWRALDLPHDWSVEALLPPLEASGAGTIWGDTVVPARVGPFDVYASEGKRDTAWVVGGTGWYRKRFNAHPGAGG